VLPAIVAPLNDARPVLSSTRTMRSGSVALSAVPE
jgi:hypothetical protein